MLSATLIVILFAILYGMGVTALSNLSMTESTAFFTFFTGISVARIVIGLFIVVLGIVGSWIMLEKAKLPGRGIFIPIYNVYLSFKLAGRPEAWTRWILIPPVFYILWIIAQFDIAKRF
jgi:hypothetical protein